MIKGIMGLNYLVKCPHLWIESGQPFKYSERHDVSPTNPLKQVYKCDVCDAVKVEIVRTEP